MRLTATSPPITACQACYPMHKHPGCRRNHDQRLAAAAGSPAPLPQALLCALCCCCCYFRSSPDNLLQDVLWLVLIGQATHAEGVRAAPAGAGWLPRV